jgi:acetylornithine/succinyldiaminopimelate/putrescine aminotransferase
MQKSDGRCKKSEKLGVEDIITRAQQWADDYEPYQKIRRERMGMLKSAQMDRDSMLRLIGILVEKRILHDTQNEVLRLSSPYPLNSSQINETSEQLIALMRHDEPVSYWDAYQQLNTVLKPARMDIPQVLPQSLALFECLTEMIK